jgi:polysaccharide export outer membrane protein
MALLAVASLWAGAAAGQSYLIEPGDRLSISVIEDPSLNRTVLVRPDGRISMPLAGSIQAGGRTTEAVETAIRRALSRDFVQPPTVSVALEGLGQAPEQRDDALTTIYVIGQVARPGRYDVESPVDILQALAVAGGPGVFAATGRIQVRRRAPTGETLFLFDFDMVQDGEVPSEPVTLLDGDVIVVPQRRLFE